MHFEKVTLVAGIEIAWVLWDGGADANKPVRNQRVQGGAVMKWEEMCVLEERLGININKTSR